MWRWENLHPSPRVVQILGSKSVFHLLKILSSSSATIARRFSDDKHQSLHQIHRPRKPEICKLGQLIIENSTRQLFALVNCSPPLCISSQVRDAWGTATTASHLQFRCSLSCRWTKRSLLLHHLCRACWLWCFCCLPFCCTPLDRKCGRDCPQCWSSLSHQQYTALELCTIRLIDGCRRSWRNRTNKFERLWCHYHCGFKRESI